MLLILLGIFSSMIVMLFWIYNAHFEYKSSLKVSQLHDLLRMCLYETYQFKII